MAHLLSRLVFQPSLAVRYLGDVVAKQEIPLKLSEACINKLKEVAAPNESLRITVDSGGCSGFLYNFELDSNVSEEDVVIEEQGARVVIDNTSLSFLEGAIVDYHSELIKSSFRIVNNPKAEAGCSCGVSFAVKLD
uniref:Iron-sulfur cluster assembly 2 homolog, mitochondrial n=1 Tax=Lygus hesperus TaxID=30085 RepID=A0A0K8T9M0_LYGHE